MSEKIYDMLKLSSPKVIAMYEAVNELMKEGQNLYTLKVSDITARAGIGKGTAYEYFETKEELISKAVFYQMAAGMHRMLSKIEKKEKFRDKIDMLLSDIEENLEQRRLLTRYLCYYTQGLFQGTDFISEIQRCSGANQQVGRFMEHMLAAAVKEGLIPEGQPIHFAANAILTQAMGYMLYLEKMTGAEEIKKEDMKKFVYNNIIKILSS